MIAAADALLGLGLSTLHEREVENRRTASDLAPEELQLIKRLIAERTQARQDRQWTRADQIREELHRLGVHVTDTPQGPMWELVS